MIKNMKFPFYNSNRYFGYIFKFNYYNLISIFSYNIVINVSKRFGLISIIISTRTKCVEHLCQILNLFGRSLYPMY